MKKTSLIGGGVLWVLTALVPHTQPFAWAIEPHRPNYALPLSWKPRPNVEPYRLRGSDLDLDEVEIQFQVSFKTAVRKNILGSGGDLMLAYTQVSYWQAYNSDESAPFRDTNYEPEAFYSIPLRWKWKAFRGRDVSLGFVHQSNGQGEGPFTRSWNRLYAQFGFEMGDFNFALKPWWRVSDDARGGNPNIDKFYGNGEFRAVYRLNAHVFSLLLRNNLRGGDNKGAFQGGWSFPMLERIKGYVHFFSGYGEGLLDYNKPSERLALGFQFTDWQ